MEVAEVLDVLDALDRGGVRLSIAGGWGVDALVGRQTRQHRDLDLLVHAEDLQPSLTILAERGYAVQTDWLPLRVEVAASDSRWVDVHPVVFDAEGNGLQGDPVGVHYRYPRAVFTSGRIGGRPVPCLSVAHQLVAHTGYRHRPQDAYDVRLLDELAERRGE